VDGRWQLGRKWPHNARYRGDGRGLHLRTPHVALRTFSDGLRQLGHCAVALSRILGQRLGDERRPLGGQLAQVWRRRQMLHQDFAGRLAIERQPAGQHFVQNDAARVNIDLPTVVAGADLRRHVVNRTDALRVGRALTAAEVFAQPVIAHLDDAVFEKDVRRFQVSMHDAMIVQIADRPRQTKKPLTHQIVRQALGMSADHRAERLTGHILHDDPVIAVRIGAQIVQMHEVGVLEIEAQFNAAQLHFGFAAKELEGDLFATIADAEIDPRRSRRDQRRVSA